MVSRLSTETFQVPYVKTHAESRLYIIEGSFTVIFAFGCFFLIPKDYQSAWFLNQEDKEIMRHRDDETRAYSGGSGHYKKKDLMLAVADIKTWVYAFNHMFCMTLVYGMS
jgi:hypothetical protein